MQVKIRLLRKLLFPFVNKERKTTGIPSQSTSFPLSNDNHGYNDDHDYDELLQFIDAVETEARRAEARNARTLLG